MRQAIVSLLVVIVFCGRASGACHPGDFSTCTTGERLAWIVAIPVWVPLAMTYKLLGGEFGNERAEREQKQQQAVAAWQRMTPAERQEAIQLMQLQQQQQALDQQNSQKAFDQLLQWDRQVNPPLSLSPTSQGSVTSCRRSGLLDPGDITCTTEPW